MRKIRNVKWWWVVTESKTLDGGNGSGRHRFDADNEEGARAYAEGLVGRTSHWSRNEAGDYAIPSGRYVSARVEPEYEDVPQMGVEA